MERHRRAIVLTVVLATLSIAAGPPVALRVETAAVRPEGDATIISVTVQVAPEDRSRLGRDVWVQGELLRGGERVNRVARAVDLDERGQAAFEVAWPPGDYELRVSIEGAKGNVGGMWVGPLTVPAMTAEALLEPATAPTTAATLPPPQAGIAGAPAEPAPAAATEPSSSEPLPVAAPEIATAAAATAAAAQPAATLPKPQPEIAQAPAEPVPEPATEPSPSEAPPVVAPVVTAAPAAATVGAAQPVEALPPQQPEITEAPTEPAPEDTSEPSPAEAPPVAAPEVTAAATSAAAVQPAANLPSAVAPAGMAGSGWGKPDDGLTDVTVVVTERNRPILGLDPSAFRLRVGGSVVAVEEVGDAHSAPLNLAVVADLSPDAGDMAQDVARELGKFSHRTRDGGHLLVDTSVDPRPMWGADPDSIARWAEATGEGRPDDLAELVAEAAWAFAGRRGRSFLLVVSDGSDTSDKVAWRETAAAAEASGVPVFVIGLRDSGFDDRARSGLGRIADATGGRSYFLGSSKMAGMTLDYVGELIDASYALAFRLPPGGAGSRELRVEVANRDWDVHHSRRVP